MARHAKKGAETPALGDDQSASTCGAGYPSGSRKRAPRRRVLLVEDHPAALELLAAWLGEHGFRTEEFENLEEAMRSLTDGAGRSVH
jgi:PleD family two-component response regulator